MGHPYLGYIKNELFVRLALIQKNTHIYLSRSECALPMVKEGEVKSIIHPVDQGMNFSGETSSDEVLNAPKQGKYQWC